MSYTSLSTNIKKCYVLKVVFLILAEGVFMIKFIMNLKISSEYEKPREYLFLNVL